MTTDNTHRLRGCGCWWILGVVGLAAAMVGGILMLTSETQPRDAGGAAQAVADAISNGDADALDALICPPAVLDGETPQYMTVTEEIPVAVRAVEEGNDDTVAMAALSPGKDANYEFGVALSENGDTWCVVDVQVCPTPGATGSGGYWFGCELLPD